MVQSVLSTRLGFEPRQRKPKFLVLPLHYRVIHPNRHGYRSCRAFLWSSADEIYPSICLVTHARMLQIPLHGHEPKPPAHPRIVVFPINAHRSIEPNAVQLDENILRAVCVTDRTGSYKFLGIRPMPYTNAQSNNAHIYSTCSMKFGIPFALSNNKS